MLPFEFTIPGPPVSQQARRSKRKALWLAAVTTAATQAWLSTSPPAEQEVLVEITHFYKGGPADVDNIPKPILDAIKGLVFKDDKQVTDLLCRRRPIAGPFVADRISLVLASAIAS